MEFTKEALELLQSTAQQAAAATVLDLPGDNRTAYVAINGELQPIAIPPAVRNHAVRTLVDLGRYAIAAAVEYGRIKTAPRQTEDKPAVKCCPCVGPPVVYHDEEACVLVLNDWDRRDLVTFKLELSEQWETLEKLAAEKPLLSQKELIQAMRLVFDADSTLIASFRRIDLKTKLDSTSQINRGRESLGKSIEAEIVNAQDIPETVTLNVPIYRNQGEDARYAVTCAVEVDAINGRVQIVPEPGRLDEIMHRHQADIHTRLVDQLTAALAADNAAEMAPIYYGSPC